MWVYEDGTVDLPGESDAAHVRAGNPSQAVAHRSAERAPPVVGILLAPARLWFQEWIVCAASGDRVALVVEQLGLGPTRIELNVPRQTSARRR